MGEVALIVAGIVILAALVLGRQLSLRVGQVHATVQGIDRAVNHRQPGEPTLVEQVDRVAADVDELRTTTGRINDRLTGCETKLSELAGTDGT